MNTNKIYIASLRGVINRMPITNDRHIVKHTHLKLVLVRCNNINKGIFKDVISGEKYMDITKGFRSIGIALDLIEPFNYATENMQKNLPKQKVLSLYNDVRSKYIEYKKANRNN